MTTLRDHARDWLVDAVPSGHVVTSDGKPYVSQPGEASLELVPGSKSRFLELTGCSHEALKKQWDDQASLPPEQRAYKTACNEFAGRFGSAMGLGHVAAIDPYDYLKSLRALDAWVYPDGHAWPRCGDIVQHVLKYGYHVCISLHLAGDDWTSVDAGQGGPKRGHDVIKRVGRKFSGCNLKGWIDLDRLFAIHNRVRPGLERAVGDLHDHWYDEDGTLVHPNAPAGRGGAGGFRLAGAGEADGGHPGLWHPDAPADRYLGPLAGG